MTLRKQPPPYGPDPDDVTQLAQWAIDAAEALSLVTQEILAQGTEPDYPQLSQWILQRGQLLARMGEIPVDALPVDVRERLLTTLIQCQALDEAVTQNLQRCYANLEVQLRGIKGSRGVLDKYRVSDLPEMETRSQDA